MRRREHTNNESERAKGTLWDGINQRDGYGPEVSKICVCICVCKCKTTCLHMYERVQMYTCMCIYGYIS